MKNFISKVCLASFLAFGFQSCQAASKESEPIRLDAVATSIETGNPTGKMVFASPCYDLPVTLHGIPFSMVFLGAQGKFFVDYYLEEKRIVLGSHRPEIQALIVKHKISDHIGSEMPSK